MVQQRQKKIAVITSIYGNYDVLKDYSVEQEENVDWYCFTDNPDMNGHGKWEIVTTPYHLQQQEIGKNDFNQNSDNKIKNMMSAKYYKIKTHEIDILKNYDYYIWIDGSLFMHKDCLNILMPLIDENIQLINFKHSRRNTIEEELKESLHMKKYDSQDLASQYHSYKEDGFPDNIGLFENTMYVKKNAKDVNQLMDVWWSENVTQSFQDQLSYPYAIWKSGMFPDVVIHENVFNNHSYTYADYNLMKNHWEG